MPQEAASVAEQTLEITVIRADGRVEHLGVVSEWRRNPRTGQLEEFHPNQPPPGLLARALRYIRSIRPHG